MNDICVFCLTKGRDLHSIAKIGWFNCFPYVSLEDSQYMLYLQNESLLRVCFECKARVDNVHKFVQQSVHSLRILKEYWTCSTQTAPPPRSRLTKSVVDIHDTNFCEAFAQTRVDCRIDDEEKDVFKHVVKVEFDNQPQPSVGKLSTEKLSTRKLSTSIKCEDVDASSIDDAFDVYDSEVVQKTKKPSRKRSKTSKRPVKSPLWSSTWLSREQASARYAAECERDSTLVCERDSIPAGCERDSTPAGDVLSLACALCRRRFACERELAAHEAVHDEKIGPHDCDICHYRFPEETALKRHLDQHYLLFSCRQCSYEAVQLSAMETHAEGHQFDSADEMPLNKCKEARQCKKCKSDFSDAAELRRHQAQCSRFKCDYCEKVFGHRTSKYSHMDLHHKPQEQVSCKHCNKTFKNKYAIKSHLLKHRREYSGGAYSCAECSQEFRTAVAYKQHYYKLLRDRPSAHACTHCPAAFAAQAELARHVCAAHLADTVHTCDRCHKWFIHKRALSLHAAAAHGGGARAPPPRDKICDVCGKGFTSTTILRNHLRSHSGERPFACALCPAAFAHSGSLYTHTRLVHKKRRRKDAQLDAQLFPCSVCGKEFTSEPSMRVHYEFFHLKKSKFVCELCNKMFISAWNLKNHKKMLHGVNRTRSYPCTVCGREFFRVDALKSHKLIHSEDRTFMCSECGKTFKQQAALYTHNKLVHKGIKRAAGKPANKQKPKLVGAE